MCLIAIDRQENALTVAANRDEFHHRPTLEAAWWDDAPQVWGGRDQQAGGAWFAVSRSGRFAAVTNVRRMLPPRPDAPSRGALVQAFMNSMEPSQNFASALQRTAQQYSGFNLLLFDGMELIYSSNEPDYVQRPVGKGVHVLSNASLDTPWPKSERLRDAMLSRAGDENEAREQLFTALADRRTAADENLPDTGVGLEMERFLSSAFICSPRYGTRASTVMQLRNGMLRIEERRFDPQARLTGSSAVEFEVLSPAPMR